MIFPFRTATPRIVRPVCPVADMTDKSSVVRAKAPMHCAGGRARKLRVTQMKQRLVIASLHVDLRLCLDAIVDAESAQSVCTLFPPFVYRLGRHPFTVERAVRFR